MNGDLYTRFKEESGGEDGEVGLLGCCIGYDFSNSKNIRMYRDQ